MFSSNPLLKFTSTQIRAKLKILCSNLSKLVLRYRPRLFPILSRTYSFQKWRGRLWSLTHTGNLETVIVLGSKSGNHGVINNLVDPQNQGPSLIIISLSSEVWNFTIKKPLEQRWISQSRDHWWKSNGNGLWVWATNSWSGRLMLELHMSLCTPL